MKAFICNECHRVISERDLFFWKNWNFSTFYCSAECYAKSHGGVRYELGSKEHVNIVKKYDKYEENDEQSDEETNDFGEFGRFAGLDLD